MDMNQICGIVLNSILNATLNATLFQPSQYCAWLKNWSTTLTAISTIAAVVVAIVIARRQLIILHKQAAIQDKQADIAKLVGTREATEAFYSEWWGDEQRKLRYYFLWEFVPKYRAKLKGTCIGLKEVEKEIPEDEGKALHLCYFFDRVGSLGAIGLIDVDYVLMPMQHVMRRTWIVMEELIMEERKNKGAGKYDPIFCYGFQWLYKRSDKTHQASLLKKFSDPAIFKKEDIDKLKNEIDADEKAYREMFHGLMSTERNRDNDTCRRIP